MNQAADWLGVDSIWNVMTHGDTREGKWRGNWPIEWVASTLHTTSEHGVSTITTTDAHTSAASSRLNWRPRRFKWTCTFCWTTKSGFCACAVTFQLASISFLFETLCLVFLFLSLLRKPTVVLSYQTSLSLWHFSITCILTQNQNGVLHIFFISAGVLHVDLFMHYTQFTSGLYSPAP
jgi:hypothetical protein